MALLRLFLVLDMSCRADHCSFPPSFLTSQALAKRQAADLGPLNSFASALLGNTALAPVASSIENDPAFLSAVQAAATSNFVPLESLAASLQANPTFSAFVYSAIGTSSADALYSQASAGIAELQAATGTAASSAASSLASGASSVASSSSAASASASAGTASGAAGFELSAAIKGWMALAGAGVVAAIAL